MTTPTESLLKYREMPTWTTESLPAGFRKMHNTKIGTWAKLRIDQGQLNFYALDEAGNELASHLFSAENQPPFIEPQAWHRVEPASNDLICQLAFYCEPEHYFEKKYSLTAPHSEVKALLQHIQGGRVLDLGSGRGRNSLFLHQQGFKVTALDQSETMIQKLNEIIAAEPGFQDIQTGLYDIQQAAIAESYDLILSTVVMQFLRSDCIPAVIRNMQEHTKPNGIHLIVAPISTPEMPCPIEFPHTFQAGELQAHYAGWDVLKYTENLGEFHRTDAKGNRHQAMFATLVARKKSDSIS